MLNASERKRMKKTEEPWLRIPIKAIKDPELTFADAIILAVIIDRTDAGECRLSYTAIAEAAGATTRTVQNAVKKLVAKHYVKRVELNGETGYFKQLILAPKKKNRTEQAKKESESLLEEKNQAKTLKEKAEEADFSEAYELMQQGLSFAEAVEKIAEKEN